MQDGRATVIHIINADSDHGKAVKVRLPGATNSDDVFDFTLFLSPHDVWSGAITQTADGGAAISTPDTSCTLPANPMMQHAPAPVPFSPFRLVDPSRLDLTTEGYVEIMNMADIPEQVTVGTTIDAELFKSIEHVNGVPPCDFDAAALTNTTSEDGFQPGRELLVASGHLMGSWAIVDLAHLADLSAPSAAPRRRSSRRLLPPRCRPMAPCRRSTPT